MIFLLVIVDVKNKIDDHSFKFCDANNKGAGWDINGKYYYKGEDDKYHEDSSKDIKFENKESLGLKT